jgi:transposase
MSKQYREPPSRQTLLLPPSMEDWLPEGHLARFVMDVVDEIDLKPIESVIQAKDPRGTRPYSPQMMVGLLFYAYATGRFSSRRIARGCVEDVALRVISRDTQPHFTSIAEFRRVHLTALAGLFKEVLRLCREAGLVRGVDVWLDGTKVKANASKHKAMSYAGMKEREARLDREIEELLRLAEEADTVEDEQLGDGRDEGDGVAAEVKRRESRKEWIRRTREALEKDAKEARAEELRDLARANNHTEKDDPSERQRDRTRASKQIEKADSLDSEPKDPAPAPTENFPEHAPPTTPEGAPKPEAQRNFTDPDSKIMKNGQGAYEQAFNAQVVVDESHVIVATGVTNMAADTPHVPVMLARTTESLGRAPGTLTADNGYYSEGNILTAVEAGVQPYFAIGRERRSWPPPEPSAGAPPEDDAKAWMAWQLRTERGRERMRLRKSKVELVFGCIKAAMGFRQFLLRGIHKVRAEWELVCLAYNLRKLHSALA